MTTALPDPLQRAASAIRADLPGLRRTPSPLRFLLAMVAAVVLSLLACAVVAAATVAIAPGLAGYEHLQAPDWAKLTIIGVVLASLGWPVATAIWSRARVPFLVLTVIVTVVSFAPDAWILLQGQPAGGVLALAVMHVLVAVATYPALVLIAPQRG